MNQETAFNAFVEYIMSITKLTTEQAKRAFAFCQRYNAIKLIGSEYVVLNRNYVNPAVITNAVNFTF